MNHFFHAISGQILVPESERQFQCRNILYFLSISKQSVVPSNGTPQSQNPTKTQPFKPVESFRIKVHLEKEHNRSCIGDHDIPDKPTREVNARENWAFRQNSRSNIDEEWDNVQNNSLGTRTQTLHGSAANTQNIQKKIFTIEPSTNWWWNCFRKTMCRYFEDLNCRAVLFYVIEFSYCTFSVHSGQLLVL